MGVKEGLWGHGVMYTIFTRDCVDWGHRSRPGCKETGKLTLKDKVPRIETTTTFLKWSNAMKNTVLPT